MGKITIEGYGKKLYEKELPDKVCFAIAKDREAKDKEFSDKLQEMKQAKLSDKDLEAFK